MKIVFVFKHYYFSSLEFDKNSCLLSQFLMVNVNSTWSFRQMCCHKYPDYKYQNYDYKYRKRFIFILTNYHIYGIYCI